MPLPESMEWKLHLVSLPGRITQSADVRGGWRSATRAAGSRPIRALRPTAPWSVRLAGPAASRWVGTPGRFVVGKRVLMVDDDPNFGRLVRELLERNGYAVTVVTSGTACLETARREPPDLIVLDVMMPGMDGYDVCQELRNDAGLRNVPVVILTAMEDPKLNQRAFAAGAKLCMTKPLRPDKFLHAVQMALLSAARKPPKAEKKG